MTTVGNIFDIKRFAIHDGPGIRTTVFFTGCPLDCWWCHNPECKLPGNGSAKPVGREISTSDLIPEILKDQIFYDQSGGGVTFSGGEPMMQIDFLQEMLTQCRVNGIRTAVDTCGEAKPESFDRISHLTDLFLYDIKIIDDMTHTKYTGLSNRRINENLVSLTEHGNNVNVRVPLIPGITDTDENLKAIADFLIPLRSIKLISLLPYNLFGEDKLKRFELTNKLGHLEAQSDVELEAMATIFRSQGFSVKIGG